MGKQTKKKSEVTSVAIFEEKSIRRIWHNEEWWFSVIDVVKTLTDSANPIDYIKKMRQRDTELGKGWGQIVTPLTLQTEGGAQSTNYHLNAG